MTVSDPRDEPYLRAVAGAVLEGSRPDWESLEARLPRAELHDIFRQLRAIRVLLDAQNDSTGGREGGVTQAGETAQVPFPSWGHLLVQTHVASGSFGDVYRAWDPHVERAVALKVSRSTDADAQAAVEEACLLARVRHPNVVTVYGAARIEGTVGLWMEFVEGPTLAKVIRDSGPMAAPRVIELGVTLCEAVEAVHRAGLLHRDIKAQNVVLGEDGRVVLMDFGAGRELRQASAPAGTKLYAAPELRRGAGCSRQSDVYSLGILLLFLASGCLFEDADADRRGPIQAEMLSSLGPLGAVLARAVADLPEDRFASAADLANALRQLTHRPGHTRRVIGVYGALLLAAGLAVERSVTRGRTSENDRVEKAWQQAIPRPAGIPTDRVVSLGFMGPGDVLAGVGAPTTAALMTFDLASRTQQAWVRDPSGSGHAETPVLAPDGKRLAYVWYKTGCDCAELRFADASGTVTRVPLNRRIAAAALGPWTSHFLPLVITADARTFEIGLLDVRPGIFKTLVTLERSPAGFSLSPDGAWLAYDRPRGSAPGADRDVRVLDTASGREMVVAGTSADERMPYWTPDGRTLVFLQRGHINALAAVTLRDGRWSAPVTLREPIGTIQPLGFTRAGDYVYEESPRKGDIQIAPLRDRLDSTQVPAPISRMDGAGGMMPAWSPDGLAVAWVSSTVANAASLVIRTLSTGVERRVPGHLDGVVFPKWSPDGTRIAAWGLDRLTRTLQLIDVKSGAVTELARRARPRSDSAWGLAWRSNELLLIGEDHHSITEVDARTGKRRTVYATSSGALGGDLSVSPDRESVAFVSWLGERATLMRLSLRTSELSGIWSTAAADGPGVGDWHPSGESVFLSRFSAGQNTTAERDIWELPLGGQRLRKVGIGAPLLLYFSVSPQADRIVFQSGIPGSDVWILPVGASAPPTY